MSFELLIAFVLALLLGILAGTITGLLPGIHINLVSVLITSSLASLYFLPAPAIAVFIAAMAITHTFVDFIPSIYLGAPEEDTFLAVLPGHQMLKQGLGHEAAVITLRGSLLAIIIILLFAPFFIFFLPGFEEKIQPIVPFVLVFISLYIIVREDKIKIVSALIVFLLSGILGYLALNTAVEEPLLPLLAGLFGSSALIVSIKDKVSIKKQKLTPLKKIKLSPSELKNSILSALIVSPFCSFLPAVGSGYAALIGSEILKQTQKAFLFLVGMLNTIIMGLSFIVIYSISKARTGAAAAISTLLEKISLEIVLLLMLSLVIAGTASYFLGIKISKIFAKNISKISYSRLSLAAIVALLLAVFVFSNLAGMIVFLTSASLGVFAIKSGIKRIHLMGCLLVPTIIYYVL